MKESEEKDKAKVMEKINELNKEKQEYIKEKQIIKQGLNKKEQELNKNEQELTNNKTEINNLKIQKQILQKELDDIKEEQVKRSSITETPSMLPKMLQDDKARTFALPDNTAGPSPLERINKSLSTLKNLDDKTYSFEDELTFDEFKKPADFKMDDFLKSKYERIDLNEAKNLSNLIDKEITEGGNIIDFGNNNEIYFRDLANFLEDVKLGNINDLNKEREYKKRLKNTEIKFANRTKFSKFTRLYEQYININIINIILILFTKRSSGKGLNVSSLPILLPKIYTNNSSKELINDIKQLVKNLYDNKKINKQVYNILNKALSF